MTNIAGSIISGLKAYFSNLTWVEYFLTVLDIALVAAIVYLVLIFIKGTRASRIIYGIVLLGLIFVLGRILDLQTLNWSLKHIATLIAVAIPVVFQPELRRALEKLGRSRFFREMLTRKQVGRIINEIIKAARILQKNKVGALIIIKRQTGLDDYIESGTVVDSELSSELLLNLFFPNSPLHDGAVIIKEGRIAAAGCMLPLSQGEYSYTHGTRHRAALGITEETDAIAIVISEERGTLSISHNGKLIENINEEETEKKLLELLKETP
ncbi:MAG: diadenylate cyclase CdaA [Parcubacteria group bacterium]